MPEDHFAGHRFNGGLASNGVNDPQRFTLTASCNVDGILALLPDPLNAGNMAM
ncbi:hypothetical protein [Sphingomonas sp. S2M10]|uniref:hypothetical protein n=1 Tax=Sphingomonas sp. S2M10 TaxID=2705010 RepID=UPI00145736E0|nr:hypothetical protein [Sphingomonas sp. S2M10]